MTLVALAFLVSCAVYGTQTPISSVNRKRRLRVAGHSVRQLDHLVSELLLREATHGIRNRGGQARTLSQVAPYANSSKNFVDTLEEDTGCRSSQEVSTCFEGRDTWRGIVSRRSPKNVDR